MKTEIDGHLYAATKDMIDAARVASDLAFVFVREMTDTPTARASCRESLDRIDRYTSDARSRLNLYAAGQADHEAALDGAAEGVRKAIDTGRPANG